MRIVVFGNKIKGCGLSIEGGTIYNEGREAVGKYTTNRNEIEEISTIPEIDDKIAKAVLGME